MTPLTTLYDEYIDGPKLTKQKRPFEYIVPPSLLKLVGTIITFKRSLYYSNLLLLSMVALRTRPLETNKSKPNFYKSESFVLVFLNPN